MELQHTVDEEVDHEKKREFVRTNLKWFFDSSAFIKILALVELVSCSVGQTGIEANVLLIVRKGPKSDAQLERFGDGLPGLFHHLEGDVRRNHAGAQLCQRQYASI